MCRSGSELSEEMELMDLWLWMTLSSLWILMDPIAKWNRKWLILIDRQLPCQQNHQVIHVRDGLACIISNLELFQTKCFVSLNKTSAIGTFTVLMVMITSGLE